MSNQSIYQDEIEHDFSMMNIADHEYDPSADRGDHETFDVGNHSNEYYRESPSNFGIEGGNRADGYNTDLRIRNPDDIDSSNTHMNSNNAITNNNILTLADSRGSHEIGVESLPLSTQQQIEEERLRGDILRYLVGNSNGTYHYSAELRAIIHDVIGIPATTTQTGTALLIYYTVFFCTSLCHTLFTAALY